MATVANQAQHHCQQAIKGCLDYKCNLGTLHGSLLLQHMHDIGSTIAAL
jgi:hypothetical protein